MNYANSGYFAFLIVLVGVVVFYFWRVRKRRSALKFSQSQLFRGVDPGWRVRIRELPLILKVTALVFLVLALARPQTSTTKTKRNVEGIDIVFCLDISDSMLIEDMKPENRMEASKKTIADFIQKRSSDRIGLVVFSGEAYTRVPLTLDYPLLLNNLKEVRPNRNIKMGTAIGVALANAVGRIKDSTAKSRIIIFMTDGENNSGTIDPQTALEIAKGYGLKIYSIGMGKDGQAQLPVTLTDAMGNVVKQYRPIHSKINEELLKSFADSTGGKYWRASTGQGLAEVLSTIDRLEKTKIAVNEFTKYNEEFQRYLLWAIFFYMAGIFAQFFIVPRVP